MNIVVCVKHVPDAQGDRTFREKRQHDRPRQRRRSALRADEYAVETALQLVEADGGEVTVVTMGPDQASDAIKKAPQMGADKGVHICDDALHGSDAVATSPGPGQGDREASGRSTSSSPGWPPRTARWAWFRRCSPSGSACRRSPSRRRSRSPTAP